MDIGGNVANQIDVDCDSSSDNEMLEEVVRASHGRAIPPAVIVNRQWIMAYGLWIMDYGLTWLM